MHIIVTNCMKRRLIELAQKTMADNPADVRVHGHAQGVCWEVAFESFLHHRVKPTCHEGSPENLFVDVVHIGSNWEASNNTMVGMFSTPEVGKIGHWINCVMIKVDSNLMPIWFQGGRMTRVIAEDGIDTIRGGKITMVE